MFFANSLDLYDNRETQTNQYQARFSTGQASHRDARIRELFIIHRIELIKSVLFLMNMINRERGEKVSATLNRLTFQRIQQCWEKLFFSSLNKRMKSPIDLASFEINSFQDLSRGFKVIIEKNEETVKLVVVEYKQVSYFPYYFRA